MRVFLDTNVIVAAVATRGLCSDVLHAVLAEHVLVVGETVLSELGTVLGRKLGVPPGIVREVVAFLGREGEVVAEAPGLQIRIRDPADVAILAEAAGGRADVLVTGDRDLLAVAKKAPFRIVDPRGLWEQLRTVPG